MRFKPVISLHGSGESVVLSNGAHADFTLMQGASGLGVRPQDISSVALPSGGSLVSHRRGTEAVVQLPILLGGTPRKRWDLRRKLERLCAGEVEVRVSRPNGVYRSRFGFYQAGLDGEYGAGEDSPDGQKIVLEIFSPTGLWKGEEQSPEFRLAGLRKRFLSDPAGRVPTGRLNQAVNPSLETSGDGWAKYNWGQGDGKRVKGTGAVGDWFFRLTSDVERTGNAGRYADHAADVKKGEKWTVSMFVRPSRDMTLRAQGEFRDSSGVVGKPVLLGDETFCPAGEWTRIHSTMTADGDATMIRHQTYLRDAEMQAGDTLDLDGEMVCAGGISEYFDGDSDFCAWTGEPHASASEEYVKESTYQSPFLPIVLASSTVQGEITVEIGGDAPAYPTWVVDGPGTDLIIENDEGEHLKVLTEFSEQVTITTDPLMQDIVSPNNPDGELWEFVPTNSKFFPLKPGKNRLKVSMVGAKPNSRVRLLYRETYKAGW